MLKVALELQAVPRGAEGSIAIHYTKGLIKELLKEIV